MLMMVRPRRVGTFLMSRCSTGRKLSAVSRMSSASALVRSSIDSRSRLAISLLPGRADQHDLVSAVGLGQAHLDAFARCGRQVLADVVGPDRQLAMATVH